jgi:hypothetical protein
MSIFSSQPVFCVACGVLFATRAYQPHRIDDKTVCSLECYEELSWRKTLGITGKTWYPDPQKEGTDYYDRLRAQRPEFFKWITRIGTF